MGIDTKIWEAIDISLCQSYNVRNPYSPLNLLRKDCLFLSSNRRSPNHALPTFDLPVRAVDSLGSVLTVTAPGNNAATSNTTTYNYTTDGAAAQAIGE